jgi:hypothetical protein
MNIPRQMTNIPDIFLRDKDSLNKNTDMKIINIMLPDEKIGYAELRSIFINDFVKKTDLKKPAAKPVSSNEIPKIF